MFPAHQEALQTPLSRNKVLCEGEGFVPESWKEINELVSEMAQQSPRLTLIFPWKQLLQLNCALGSAPGVLPHRCIAS